MNKYKNYFRCLPIIIILFTFQSEKSKGKQPLSIGINTSVGNSLHDINYDYGYHLTDVNYSLFKLNGASGFYNGVSFF